MSIVHNEVKKVFEIESDGYKAKLSYHLDKENNEIEIYETLVPKELKGKGLAAELAKEALDFAIKKNMSVIPSCSYIHEFMKRHKEYKDLL